MLKLINSNHEDHITKTRTITILTNARQTLIGSPVVILTDSYFDYFFTFKCFYCCLWLYYRIRILQKFFKAHLPYLCIK